MTVLTGPPLVTRYSPARSLAGLGTVLAGVLHAAAAVDHASAGWWVPSFFAVTALAQVLAGGWLLTADPPPRLAGVVVPGTVALLVLFLVVHGTTWLGALAGHAHEEAAGGGHAVHTEGAVSLGAAGGHPEVADALGLWVVGVQGLVVAAGTLLLPARARRRTADALLVLAGLVVLAWVTGVLT